MKLYFILIMLFSCNNAIMIGNHFFENKKVVKYIGKKFIKYSIKLSFLKMYTDYKNITNNCNK